MKRHKTFTPFVINLCLGLLVLIVAIPACAQSRGNKHFEFEVFDWEDAVVRLDNFSVELGSNPHSDWYIIIYGGQNRRRGETQAWMACVSDHLVNRRSFVFGRYGLSLEQIKVVPGGYRENVTIEFWLVPRGERAPAAKPTIELQDVKFKGRVNKRWRSLCKP
ncbi:MAG TPA: hypothetical protein VE732_00760 [Nitrososphaera sp.]|jgi:hypothetical protein|nr:hypothetical protein [Nitrososphaera sp.]